MRVAIVGVIDTDGDEKERMNAENRTTHRVRTRYQG